MTCQLMRCKRSVLCHTIFVTAWTVSSLYDYFDHLCTCLDSKLVLCHCLRHDLRMCVHLFAGLLTSEDPDRVCACLQAADGLLRRHISTTKEVRFKDEPHYVCSV